MELKISDEKLCKLLKYTPNNWQAKVRNSKARFKVIVAGRRAGKTKFVALDPKIGVVHYLHLPQQKIWLVAPTYDLVSRLWDEVIYVCNRQLKPLISKIQTSKGSQKIETKLGTVLEAKSAENPSHLVGKGLDFIVADEAAKIDRQAWEQSLRPALLDSKGKAIFIGTPKRKNWFYNLYLKGQKREDGWRSWRFTTYDNNYIDPHEIDALIKDMPEIEYQQEILCDFLESSGQFFRKIDRCLAGNLEPPQSGHFYYLGVDLARKRDFTVIVVMDANTNHLVAFDRFKEIDWDLQISRIEAMARRYNNAMIYIDATTLGDPICQNLQNLGLSVEGIQFQSQKKNLLNKLSLMVDRGQITFPDIPALKNELESFGYYETRSQNIVYSAPPGENDDCVMALALACWKLGERTFEVQKDSEFKRELRTPIQFNNPFHFNSPY